jgi:hypothetical protein
MSVLLEMFGLLCAFRRGHPRLFGGDGQSNAVAVQFEFHRKGRGEEAVPIFKLNTNSNTRA